MTTPDKDTNAPTPWLIYKDGRGWYRPDASGYTNNPAEAGRYTWKDAMLHSHPNGLAGPRDGMSIHEESKVTNLHTPSDTELLRQAGEVLRALNALNESYAPFGGEIFQDRVERAWEAARAVLAAIDARKP